ILVPIAMVVAIPIAVVAAIAAIATIAMVAVIVTIVVASIVATLMIFAGATCVDLMISFAHSTGCGQNDFASRITNRHPAEVVVLTCINKDDLDGVSWFAVQCSLAASHECIA